MADFKKIGQGSAQSLAAVAPERYRLAPLVEGPSDDRPENGPNAELFEQRHQGCGVHILNVATKMGTWNAAGCVPRMAARSVRPVSCLPASIFRVANGTAQPTSPATSTPLQAVAP